jgi:hypothetical protein
MFRRVATHLGVVVAFMFTVGGPASLSAQTPPTPGSLTLTVNNGAGSEIGNGFGWLLQEDVTFDPKKGILCDPTGADVTRPCIPGTTISSDILSTNFHKSYMPVVDKASVASGGTATIAIPDVTKKYFVSVLPHAGPTIAESYSISGASIAARQTSALVVVPSQPVPTAQIFVMAFEDRAPINNALNQGELGLGGFNVVISDAGGQVLTDVFGNPLGTSYNANGSVFLLGSGIITTITQGEINAGLNPYNLRLGEAVIKNLAPGKYGVTITPVVGGPNWQQTSTIEGTKTIDAWVKAKEPRYMFELGPAGHHAEFGYVQPFADNTVLSGGGSVSGRIVNIHMSRPPDYTMHKGHPLPGCWVGLNELLLGRAGKGLYAASCNADSTFTIPNVPPGTYQLAIWDQFLDNIFALVPVTVSGVGQDLGDVGVFRWFGAQDHYVFFDDNENGVRDVGEIGIRDQVVNLRFRDGSIYQSFPTDLDGFVPFDEIFPFFSWQVAEVDFARFKATGVTVAVDAGGPVAPGEKLTPQIQADGAPVRTETGSVLVEGFQSFLGTTNQFEWGKKNYAPGENGGISGIVQYATTRAEDDPAFAGAETWEPGIPRVPVFLYKKDTTLTTYDPLNPSKILDVNGSGAIELADVDHYPFGWRNGGLMGTEDVKRNNIGGTAGTVNPAFMFNAGDAVQIVTTDSWDDSQPTGCPGSPADPFYQNGKCYDGLRNYNQVRPAVFDGGYAFTTYVSGGWSPAAAATAVLLVSGSYIVEGVLSKGYEHQSEESKNVDFGDAPIPSSLALPQACVGNLHRVPAELTLFPGVAAPSAGLDRPLCDRKEVLLSSGQNAAANFFGYTDVPVAAQVKGFILNDLANEFNPLSPNFSEKAGVSWLPVSFRDWTGREIVRVYTDQFGSYNAIVPSTYNINAPTPSGVAPHMMQICLNSPGPITDPVTGQSVIDPFYNKHYGQVCWTLHMEVGKTLYADTPILPVAAFVGPGNVQTDCDCADKTPKIFSVTAANNGGPFIPSGATGANRRLTITSLGTAQVPDPNAFRTEGNLAVTIARDFGFGTTPGLVTIGGTTIPSANVPVWENGRIVVDVPVGTPTGQLVVTRGDSDLSTGNSVTVTVGNAGIPNVRTVAQGQSIQAALDAAVAGDLILVQPGTYYEKVIMTKPVKLQGFGAGSTHIIASQSLTTLLNTWREKMNFLVNCPAALGGGQITLLPLQPNNTPVGLGGTGICGFVPGTGLFLVDEGAGIFVASKDGVFTSQQPGRIDGFAIAGSATSPGIVVNGYARYLEISNNQVANNQGTYGGGIRLGDPTIMAGAQNDHASIHHNHILQNGSQFGPGAGVALYAGSDNYRLTDNYVCGNFAQDDGGGVAHYGLSRDGLIGWNTIVFNQTFVQAAVPFGGVGAGGGLMVSGVSPVVGNPIQISEGAGSVAIVSNLIQGNNAGTGDGAGVLLRTINGLDVSASPTNSSTWYHVELFNNIIVNNVAGLAGGGIAMQDAAKVTMINNTVAHNDSTATAGLAFSAGVPNVSNPQPAGVVSSRHSTGLCQAFGLPAGCPRYSDPMMENNIVLNNRSMFWQVNTQLPLPVGEIKTAGVNDLAVLPAGSGLFLHPRNGILSDSTTGYDPSNQLVANSASVFANPYFNAPPGLGTVQPDGTIVQLEFTTTLATAAALDEGGNFIDVHYGPLTPGGSYHLSSGSPAIDAGNNGPLNSFLFLAFDYDGEPRPMDGNDPVDNIARTDIGADERTGPAGNGNRAPVITSTAVTTATVNVAYSYQVTATDVNGGPLTYGLDAVPAGMAISPTGLVTWTPAAGQVGPNPVTVRVTDNTLLSTTQPFSVTVAAPPAGPTITGFTLRSSGTLNARNRLVNPVAAPLTEGMTISLSDCVGGPCRFNMEALASGTGFNSVRFVLAGATALAKNESTFPYTTPGDGGVGAYSGMVLNLGAHTLTAIPRQNGTPVGTPLTVNFTVVASGTTPTATNDAYSTPAGTALTVAAPGVLANDVNPTATPLTATVVANPASGTLLLQATGAFTYIPAAGFTGPVSFTYRATNGTVSNVATVTITVTAAPAPVAPVITSTAILSATVGVAYSYQVTATDANGGPFTFALDAAPAGMTISATGLITWTPIVGQEGPQAVTVRVTDNTALFATQPFSVTVAAAPTGPAVTGFTLRNANAVPDVVLGPLTNGSVVSRAACGNCQFNIQALVVPGPGLNNVRLVLTGATTNANTESVAPYSMPGDSGTNFNPMVLNLGVHTITATPRNNANQPVGTPLSVTFTVTQ